MRKIANEVLGEIARAVEKFPTWPTDPLHAVAVLGEEFGELTQAVLQCVYEQINLSLYIYIGVYTCICTLYSIYMQRQSIVRFLYI